MSVKIEQIVVGMFLENTYFLIDEEKNLVIVDPGGEGDEVLEYVEKNGLKPLFIINTHGHIDHVEANSALVEKYNLPIYMHPVDAEKFGLKHDVDLSEGQLIEFGGEKLEVMHTPGHTMGSVCIKGNGFLLTGDTLFAGAIGRTDLGGSMRTMKATLEDCFRNIPDEMILFPGHGSSSTMGVERRENPYLIEI